MIHGSSDLKFLLLVVVFVNVHWVWVFTVSGTAQRQTIHYYMTLTVFPESNWILPQRPRKLRGHVETKDGGSLWNPLMIRSLPTGDEGENLGMS